MNIGPPILEGLKSNCMMCVLIKMVAGYHVVLVVSSYFQVLFI